MIRLGFARAVVWLCLMGSLARSQELVYVTDLDIFTELVSILYSLMPQVPQMPTQHTHNVLC